MKFNKVVKLLAGITLLSGGLFVGASVNTSATPTITAQAKSKSTKVVKVSYKKLSQKAYHAKAGILYTTSKLTKVGHYAVHYKNTTFYTYDQGTVKRANGKKAIYYYVKSSNGKVKGWIWHGYLTKGKAPAAKKTTSTKSTTTTSSTTATTATTGTTSSSAPITALQTTGASATGSNENTSQVTVQVFGPIADGNQILASGTVTLQDGDTAFSVLKEIATVSSTGSGSSAYVSSINGKTAGTGGGWLYTVNGVFPDYSAGAYKVKSGDVVQWLWTQTAGDRGWQGEQ